MNLRCFLCLSFFVWCVPAIGQIPDYGDLPESLYPTKFSQNGARHYLHPDLYLGAVPPDGEFDGLASSNAIGDDGDQVDDEDGIQVASLRITAGLRFTLPVKCTNLLAGEASLKGFADWNQDGDFDDTGEISVIAVASGTAGDIRPLRFDVPASAVTTTPTALRLRLSSVPNLPVDGDAPDGEVEDFFIQVHPPGTFFDFGDLPDAVSGTASGNFQTTNPPDYQTRAADGGPSHAIVPGLFIHSGNGSVLPPLDAELDGIPSPQAVGDNEDQDNDEEGLTYSARRQTFIPDGSDSRIEVDLECVLPVRNETLKDAWLVGFIDLNGDGDFSDTSEQCAPVLVTSQMWDQSPQMLFSFVIFPLTPSPINCNFATRFRISTDGPLGPNGPASDGEVVDHLISFPLQYSSPDLATNMDFGDHDSSKYHTNRAQNGPRHFIGKPMGFGASSPDGEEDAAVGLPGMGDDQTTGDDEDGFDSSAHVAVADMPFTLTLPCFNLSTDVAYVLAFVDWNDDGDFGDAGESSFPVSINPFTSGTTVSITMFPGSGTITAAGTRAIRIRMSSVGDMGPTGAAPDGEVEDHFLKVVTGLDFGDLPSPYATTTAANGARHVGSPDIFLGNVAPDLSQDVSPGPSTADADDADGLDDEDSIRISTLYPVRGSYFTVPVSVTNFGNVPGRVFGFIDWNADGDFDDTDETVSDDVWASTGPSMNWLHFRAPETASTTNPVAFRIRISTVEELSATGLAPDGEVEDYLLTVLESGLDFGDLPDSIAGTAPGVHGSAAPPDYQTTLADNGPSHVLRPGLALIDDGPGYYTSSEAFFVDAEPDAFVSSDGTGDDWNGTADEWSYDVTGRIEPEMIDGIHSSYRITLGPRPDTLNTTDESAYLSGFIDWNHDGDFIDPGESETIVIDAGSENPQPSPLSWSRVIEGPLPPLYQATHAIRLRLTTQGPVGPSGPALDGEVSDDVLEMSISTESIVVDPLSMDYGDLPDTYRTLWENQGARHVITPGLHIGATAPDGETHGNPSSSADGDDASGSADEDLLDSAGNHAYAGNLFSLSVLVANTRSETAYLHGFADWNLDGDFLDEGESSVSTVASGPMPTTIPIVFTIPPSETPSAQVPVRLRLSHQSALASFGRADSGEVEDHFITVRGGWDFGDLPDAQSGTSPGLVVDLSTVSQADYRTRLADDGARHRMNPRLLLFNDGDLDGVHVDGESDGQPSNDADGDNGAGDDDEQVLLTALTRVTATVPAPPYEHMQVQYDLLASVAVKNDNPTHAYLHGFLDANNDGDFTDPGEFISQAVPPTATFATQSLTFTPSVTLTKPITSRTIRIPLRLRLSSLPALGPDGPAPDGEVEDYMVQLSFTCPQWWPRTVDEGLPIELFADRGGSYRLSVAKILGSGASSTIGFNWSLGPQLQIQGPSPLLSPGHLQTLPMGVFSYSLIGSHGSNSHFGHHGFIRIADLSDFRNAMAQDGLIGEFAAPDGDQDSDGLSNYDEFAFGTSPTTHSPPPQMIVKIMEHASGASHLTGFYLRRAGGVSTGTDYQTMEVVYRPQGSMDLATWTAALVATVPTPDLPASPPGYEWGAVRLDSDVDTAPRGMVRLSVSPP